MTLASAYSDERKKFYIQVNNIKDVWSFSSIVSITLSRSFSSETLTGVEELCHGRPSWIEVFLS